MATDNLKSLAQEFQHLSLTQCEQALDELVTFVCAQTPIAPDFSKAVLAFVLSVAAPRCQDRRSLQWRCLRLVGAVGHAARCNDEGADRSDLHNFFFKLGKKEVKSQRMWKPRVMVTMMQYINRYAWESDLANASAEGEASCSFDVVSALLQAMYGEMGRSEKWEKKWRAKAMRILSRILTISSKVLEHAIEVMKKGNPPSILVAAIGSCAVKAGPDGPHRSILVEQYVKCILENKQVATDCALDAWGQILSLVQPAEFEKQLLPLACRMSKRQPAAMVVAFPALVAHLTIDLAPFAKEILDPFAIETLKNAEMRPRACSFIRHIVVKSAASAAPIAVAEHWAESFKKSRQS
jgi:hypothetical protein